MPSCLRPPIVPGSVPPRSVASPFSFPAQGIGAAVGVIGLAMAAALVWQGVNPDTFPLDRRLMLPAALAAAVLVAMGVFGWTGAAGCAGEAADEGADADAARMADDLRRGRAVSWAGPAYLLPAGVQVSGRVYPWPQIDSARAERRGREFFVYLKGREEPIAVLPTSATRFTPGLLVFRDFADDLPPTRLAA